MTGDDQPGSERKGSFVTSIQTDGRFAERTLHGIDDSGRTETISLWIDWLAGGQWGVGRAVNAAHRENPLLPREDDWLFRGYEMGDALEAANEALMTDLAVSAADGRNEHVRPFEEHELRRRLERWFFDHS
jgi:hypothetical protein